ncbi:MAG: flavodoxin family protein [Kiritimatiellae bacterium]|nr:flavodoxin family protein [Kiritimatiellia bacterium]
MKVIGFSGSPRKDANTDRLVRQVLAGAREAGAETKFIRIADLKISGCTSCYHCKTHYTCSIKDDMQAIYAVIHGADACVIGSPVYMGQVSGQTKIFWDRLLPLFNADFSTRLKKHPALVMVFTQGQTDTGMFKPYMENTKQVFGFMGFKTREIIVAGAMMEKADVDKQKDLMARAKETGAGLAEAELTAKAFKTDK